MGVKVIDNTQKVLSEFERKINLACKAVGQKAVDYAKADCPVDTGRLRNSIAYKVNEKNIYIGTNVEYAKYVEFIEKYQHKTGKAHFLRDAAATHGDEYRDLYQTILRN